MAADASWDEESASSELPPLEQAVARSEDRAADATRATTERRESVLVISGDIDSDSVLRELRTRIEEYKCPDSCVVLADLPIGPNGKVDHRALAAALAPDVAS